MSERAENSSLGRELLSGRAGDCSGVLGIQFLSGYLALMKISWSLGLHLSWGVYSKHRAEERRDLASILRGDSRAVMCRWRCCLDTECWYEILPDSQNGNLPFLSSLKKCSPSQQVGSSRVWQRCQGGGVLTKICSLCLPSSLSPPNLNDNSLEGTFPPQWMSELCFAFSPALGTSTLTLQHVPPCWDGKQSIEPCVLGQLSLLKSQEHGSCMKQMNKGQGTKAGLGGFGPSLRRILKNYCLPYRWLCLFSSP